MEIEEVVVTGTRSVKRLSDSPIVTSVIRDHDIVKAGNMSLTEVLQDNIPGLLIHDTGMMGIDMQIKGLSAKYILVLVDGERLVTNGREGNVDLDQVDVTNIQRIEYISDAATALYGSNAMGGVINIITKNATKRFSAGAEYTYETSKQNRVRAHISSKIDKLSLYASGRMGDQAYFKPTSGPSFAEHKEFSGDLKADYKFNDRLKAGATARYYHLETFLPPTSADVIHPLEVSYTLGANINHTSKNLRNNLTASWSINANDQYDVFEQLDNKRQPNDYNQYMSSRIVDSYSATDALDVLMGLEFNYETASSSDKLSAEGPANRSNLDANIFAQADYDFNDDLTAILGGRYTYNKMFGSTFNPKLSAKYDLADFIFRGSIGTGYRAPSLRELYYNFQHTGGGSAVFYITGNENLKAEHGFYTSLSAEYSISKFNISANAYFNRIDNLIMMVEDFGKDSSGNTTGMPNQSFQNVKSATIKGIDFSARYTPIKQLVLAANYTLCSSVNDSTGLQNAGTSLHYATLTATWNADFRRFPFSLQIAGRASSPRYSYDDGERVETEAFTIWRATLVKPITLGKHRLEATIKADNLFDFTDTYYVSAGRQYLFGLRYKFN